MQHRTRTQIHIPYAHMFTHSCRRPGIAMTTVVFSPSQPQTWFKIKPSYPDYMWPLTPCWAWLNKCLPSVTDGLVLMALLFFNAHTESHLMCGLSRGSHAGIVSLGSAQKKNGIITLHASLAVCRSLKGSVITKCKNIHALPLFTHFLSACHHYLTFSLLIIAIRPFFSTLILHFSMLSVECIMWKERLTVVTVYAIMRLIETHQ